MAIIAISRELAALGDETAQELSTHLGFRLVDRHSLEKRIQSFGVSSQKIQKYDEKKPSFWASLSQDRDDYLHFLKTAILAEAEQDNAVFIGRGAGVILKDAPGVLSLFLAAPLHIRVERVRSYFRCDEKRAHHIIGKSDGDRDGFYRYFFDVKWQDPGNYHLMLNTGYLHPAICAELVEKTLNNIFTKETNDLHIKKIKELTLGQKIKHCILYEKEISIHFLEVVVSGSKVSLYGVAGAQTLIEAAVASARESAPDYLIQPEIQIVQDYGIMP
ncbi:MAG: cytidylate kinase-like family protein [Treponema sp.]|nr:cytidylate kinase-like family protein [Treponema sp.]